MADNREIWKIDKFDGGLNDATDAKDLKSNEFAELVDVNIEEKGSISSMGHSEDSSIASQTVVPIGIHAGKGLHSFFSDKSMFVDTSINSWLPVVTLANASQGSYASMTFSLSSLLWLFPPTDGDNTSTIGNDADRPYKGDLKMQLGLWVDNQFTPVGGNGEFEFMAIHGDGGDNSNVLTVLSDSTTWEGVKGDVSTNLFDTPTYYKYTDINEYGIPSSAAGLMYYPGIYTQLWPSIELWKNNENRIAGRYWNQKSGSIDSSIADIYDFGNNYLINNAPNSPFARHLINSEGPDIGSLYADFFWDDIYNWNDGTQVQENDIDKWRATTYWDNRNIFSTPVPGRKANYGVGYCLSKGVFDNNIPNANNIKKHLPYAYGNSDIPIEEYDYTQTGTIAGYFKGNRILGKEYVCFPHPDTGNLLSMSQPQAMHYYGWAGWNSIAHHLINAINNYSGTNSSNNFNAKFTHYQYLKNPTSDITSDDNRNLLGKVNSVKSYTNRIDDTITITSNVRGSHLNGVKLAVNLTSANVTDVGGTALTQVPQRTLHALYQSDPLRGTITSNITSTAETFTTNKETAKYLKLNDVIKVENASDATEYEFMFIKGIVGSSGPLFTVNVDRAFRGPFQGTIDTDTLGIARSFSSGAKISKFEIHPMGYESASNAQWGLTSGLDNEEGHARDWGAGTYIVGEKELHGGSEVDVAHKVRIYFGGNQNEGDIATFEIVNSINLDGENRWSQVLDSGPEINAANFAAHIDANTQILGVHQEGYGQDLTSEDNYYGMWYVDVESNVLGVSNVFDLRTFIFPNAIWNDKILTNTDEEYTVIMHKMKEWGHDFGLALDDVGQTKLVGMSIFSKAQNSWITPTTPVSGDNEATWAHQLGWYEKFEVGDGDDPFNIGTYPEPSKPYFWSDSSELRIIETNFNLDNLNKVLKFIDVRHWFSNILKDLGDAYTDNNTVYDIMDEIGEAGNLQFWGFSLSDVDRSWKYSALDTSSEKFPGLKFDGIGNTTFGASGFAYEISENNDSLPGAMADFEQVSSGGVDWTGTCKFYASAIFSDGSETLPIHNFHTDNTSRIPMSINFTPSSDEDPMDDSLKFRFAVRPFANGEYVLDNLNVIGYHFYYTNSEENFDTFWSLGKVTWGEGFTPSNQISSTDTVEQSSSIPFSRYINDATGINNNTFVLDNGGSQYYIFSSMPKLHTFETLHGYSPYNVTLNARYKAHCIAGRRSFIGNVGIKDKLGSDMNYYNDKMIISPVNQLDTFPYPYNEITVDSSDGDEIVELESVGDRVLQFKKNILYILNIAAAVPSEYYLEDKFKFRGAQSKEHIVKTADGIFWVNIHGAFYYDGETITDLTLSGDEEDNKLRIDKGAWKDFVNSDTLVGYEPFTGECFVIKKHTQTVEADGDCYVYNSKLDNWSYGKGRFYTGGTTDSPRHMSNIINMGNNNQMVYVVDFEAGDVESRIPV
tara:strand:- start:2996 stop:7363 length:4368 start_codon:yes stop_codon:yes gene_type:complete